MYLTIINLYFETFFLCVLELYFFCKSPDIFTGPKSGTSRAQCIKQPETYGRKVMNSQVLLKPHLLILCISRFCQLHESLPTVSISLL